MTSSDLAQTDRDLADIEAHIGRKRAEIAALEVEAARIRRETRPQIDAYVLHDSRPECW
jgi:hypothetical protein